MAFSRIPIYFAVFLLVTSIQDVARMTYTGCKFWNTEPSSQHYIFKPFTPNIRMWILQTVFYTFFKVLTWRICLIIKSFFSWWSFSLFSWPWCVILGWYCTEKLDAYHSWGSKGSGTPSLLTDGFQLLWDVITAVRRWVHRNCDGFVAFFHQIQVMNQYYFWILNNTNQIWNLIEF